MAHFISSSCNGRHCFCGAAATHKLGEEIMHDEPCAECGSTWRYWDDKNEQGQRILGLPKNDCHGAFHTFGPNRHNLTAYVCCEHFTQVLGPATNCPRDREGP